MPAKRQYCKREPERQPGHQQGDAPPSGAQSGCSSGPAGSAIQRATGTDSAASTPSSATLRPMRITERGKLIRPL